MTFEVLGAWARFKTKNRKKKKQKQLPRKDQKTQHEHERTRMLASWSVQVRAGGECASKAARGKLGTPTQKQRRAGCGSFDTQATRGMFSARRARWERRLQAASEVLERTVGRGWTESGLNRRPSGRCPTTVGRRPKTREFAGGAAQGGRRRGVHWMTSTRKSKMSVWRIAIWMSSFCKVRRLLTSE